jgi:metal-responsive CopG/Arc/MetJ family transcriptional regulator
MLTRTVRTTLAIPAELLEAVNRAVRAGNARSRNEFVTTALRHELAALERAAIDVAFADMANDPAYQAEASEMTTAFATTDWEALRLTEAEP